MQHEWIPWEDEINKRKKKEKKKKQKQKKGTEFG